VSTEVLVVGAGGSGGEGDHVADVIGESLEGSGPRWIPRRRRPVGALLTHLADAEGYNVGEDVSAGGGGSSSTARRRGSVPILFVPEHGGLAQAAVEEPSSSSPVNGDVPGGRGRRPPVR